MNKTTSSPPDKYYAKFDKLIKMSSQTHTNIQTTNAHDDEIQPNVEPDSNYDSDATLPLPPDHPFWQMELVIYQSDDETK